MFATHCDHQVAVQCMHCAFKLCIWCHKGKWRPTVTNLYVKTRQLCSSFSNFSATTAAAKLSAARLPKLQAGDKRQCSICDIASVASIFEDRDHGEVLGPDNQKSGRLGGSWAEPG